MSRISDRQLRVLAACEQALRDEAARKYGRTYDRLYVQSMQAGSGEECRAIEAALAAANREYEEAMKSGL